MKRKDKIEALKSILSGKKTVDELVEPKCYQWFHFEKDDPYTLWTPDPGETKRQFTEEEFKAYMNSKHPKHRAVIYAFEEELDPLDEPIED